MILAAYRGRSSADGTTLFSTIQEEEIQTFPLVDTPDDQLDEEGKKEKRKQKLLKSNYDARMRMKAEKKAEKERLVSLERHGDLLLAQQSQLTEVWCIGGREAERRRVESSRSGSLGGTVTEGSQCK